MIEAKPKPGRYSPVPHQGEGYERRDPNIQKRFIDQLPDSHKAEFVNAGVGRASSSAAEAVTTAAILTAADIASNIKAKDEVPIEYRLVSAGNAQPKAASKLRAKAKSDGDDALTPLIRQVAEAIAGAAMTN